MEEAATKKRREIRPGFVLSILLHVLFAAIFLLPSFVAPPQAKPEESVNVELVPQPEEKKELATKANEKPDQPPTPTPKPDEKPQPKTEEAKQEQQPQGQKPDEPQKQPENQSKEQAEKPASKPADSAPDKPADKPEQQATVAEAPLPDMKGDQKDASTTQQADATAKADETATTPPSDSQAEQQAAAEAAAEAAAQAAQQAQTEQNTQPPADAKEQEAKNAAPTANDPASKPSSSAPDLLATNQASDMQVQQPQVPSTDQNGLQAQDAGDKSSADPQPQSPAEQAKEEVKTAPQIAVPTVGPAPTEQASKSSSASGSQGGETGGTALVTEPQPKSDAPKRAIQAKKLYSGAEMARLSKSDYDAWKKMPQRKRVVYLCRSEEKLQFGHELGATSFANSALSPAMISDTSVIGDGVLVETPNGFQRVALTCEVDSDALKVIAFSYAVKGRVSPSQLERLGSAGN